MPAFVFLEITDRNLNFLFSAVAQSIYGRKPSQVTHLTIRGPYARKVPEGVVKSCREILKQDVLRIEGVGRFNNADEEVVYLRVDSPNLRKVWWKPDYPINRFGFNPHISLYRGRDFVLAEALERFLTHEKLRLYCAEFRIVSAITRQSEMLVPPVPVALYPFHKLIEGDVKENFLTRLDVVVTRTRRRPSEPFQERHKPQSERKSIYLAGPSRSQRLERSVADELEDDELNEEIGQLSCGKRVELALQLGERGLQVFREARGIKRRTAVRELQRQRQAGRTPSRCISELIG